MKNKWLFLAVLSCLFAIPEWGQTSGGTQGTATVAPNSDAALNQDINLLRLDIRSKKKQLIAVNLALTDADATRFWPVYDRYTADLVKINNEKYSLLKEYADSWGTITDGDAVDLMKRALAVDEQVAQLRTRYLPIFLAVLPGKKSATFFQLERRIQSMIDLQLMSQVPLVQSQ